MMDGEGGCCVAPYFSGVYDMSKLDLMMLRFRPIAPKPTTGSSVSGASATENGDSYLRTGRHKRRYVRDGNSSNKRLKNTKRKVLSEGTDPSGKTSSGRQVSAGETVVTLSLLPETPDRKDSPSRRSSSSEHSDVGVGIKKISAQTHPIWLSFDDGNVVKESHVPYGVSHVDSGKDRTAVAKPVWLVGSYVTVECLTDTWIDGFGLGSTDEERIMCLDIDTCPVFISDCLNRVKWANGSCRELLGQGQQDERQQPLMVWLGMKEGVVLPVVSQAFTCRMRVTCWKEKSALTLPCDVWRMDGGGFAWRLDVKAALSLGR